MNDDFNDNACNRGCAANSKWAQLDGGDHRRHRNDGRQRELGD